MTHFHCIKKIDDIENNTKSFKILKVNGNMLRIDRQMQSKFQSLFKWQLYF